MCRLRIPGGILNTLPVPRRGAIAEELGGGYADVTTRANLQIREIPAAAAPEVLTRLADLGLTSRGSGADNIRNVTGSPTAGIDPQELIDTRPHARAHAPPHPEPPRAVRPAAQVQHRLRRRRPIPVLEDTNDIAFTAVPVADGHRRASRASTTAWRWAASPATRTSPARPA